MRAIGVILLVYASTWLMSCGQKGPLQLPDQQTWRSGDVRIELKAPSGF
ncbi:lipoprotein [Hahella sp. KA22]